MPADTQTSLTDKQQRFVDEYLVDYNGKQAAIRAGYSEKTAESQASRLLSNAKVSAAVEAGKARINSKLEISQERVLKELARIGFSNIQNVLSPAGNLLNPNDWDEDTAAAIASIEVVTRTLHTGDESDPEVEYTHKIKTWDKKGSLELLGKHLNIFQPEAATPDVHVHIHQAAKDF